MGALFTSSGPGAYSNYTSVVLGGYYESTTVNALFLDQAKVQHKMASQKPGQHCDVPSVVNAFTSSILNYLPSAAAGRIS